MITGSAHTLSSGMAQSLQDYRSYLDEQRENLAATGDAAAKSEAGVPDSPAQPVEPGTPSAPVESRPVPDKDQLEAAAQQRQDTARQAAVYTAELQQPQQLLDIYMNASSEEEISGTNSIDPTSVYQESLKYSRRTDLLEAFEKAGQLEQEGTRINIVV